MELDRDVNQILRVKILSGQVTLQDIVSAGLKALQQTQGAEQSEDHDACAAGSRTALRKDRIIAFADKVQQFSIPSVHTNHLRVMRFLMAAALRTNAETLGVTWEDAQTCEGPSPFLDGRANNMVIKPDLRPTAAQLQRHHDPFFDLFPCPLFRQRVMELLYVQPPLIDEDELIEDIMALEGVVCWGSQASGDPQATGSGAPWDIRSWEMEPWFLEKWWYLVGGTEGAFYRQSKWWREYRGDEPLVLDFAAE